MMKQTAEVVIVGGGLIGLSIAYHAARAGCRQVVVLEREDVLASQSSARSAGGIRLQFSSAVNIALSRYSLDRLKCFGEEMGIDPGLRQVGYLFLISTREDWEKFVAQSELQRSMGVPTQMLTPGQVKELAPYVTTEDLVGATFCPEDGYADPYSIARAYETHARQLGVQMWTGTEVTGICTEGGRVTGVETAHGKVACPVVVNAAGAWAGELGRLAGVAVPVRPYRRQIYVTDPCLELPDAMPLTIDFTSSAYCRKEGPRVLMGMSDPEEPPSFRTHTDDAFLVKLLERITHRVPLLIQTRIYRGWAGLYEVTPDHNALLGEHPELGGFFLANGFSGHGFQHSPAVGRLIAEMVTGRNPFIDVSALSLSRFLRGEEMHEQTVV